MAELRQMQAVQAVVEAVVQGPDDIAYLSGSLVEGFGNSASDIDLFLVTVNEPGYGGAIGSVLGDYYLDMEMYRLDRIHDLAERLNSLNASEFLSVWQTSLSDLDLYYRTLIGKACHNPDGFEVLRGRFRREVVASLLAAWCGLRYIVAIQHAREEMEAGRVVNAALSAQAAAAWALDSYLAAQGECFPSLKWRFEKLARLSGPSSDLYGRAWRLKAAGNRDALAYIEDVAAFGDDLGMRAYEAWSLDDVPLQRTGDSRCFTVSDQRYVVQDRRFIYNLDPDAAGVLALVDGGTTRRRLAGELNNESAIRLRDSLASLQASGLIRGY